MIRTVKFDGTTDISERRKTSDLHSVTVKHRTSEWTASDRSVMVQDFHDVLTLITGRTAVVTTTAAPRQNYLAANRDSE